MLNWMLRPGFLLALNAALFVAVGVVWAEMLEMNSSVEESQIVTLMHTYDMITDAKKDIHATRDAKLDVTVEAIAEADAEREHEFTLEAIPRIQKIMQSGLEDVVDQLLLSENSNVAICRTDYWLNTLWAMMLALVAHLESDKYTLEEVMLYANGLVYEGYGGDDTMACEVDEDGNWVVKDTW